MPKGSGRAIFSLQTQCQFCIHTYAHTHTISKMHWMFQEKKSREEEH